MLSACCLCFSASGVQMGKFYELFHMDAATSVSHLGLIYMKVSLLNWFEFIVIQSSIVAVIEKVLLFSYLFFSVQNI